MGDAPPSLWVICGTAAFLGFFHTLVGPDHYVPFVMLGRANRWSASRLAAVTVLCGVGHVLSSVVLGIVGIGFGVALRRLEIVESLRGEVASWALIGFGLAYMVWGLRRAWKGRTHAHPHTHADGLTHVHGHVHDPDHGHLHGAEARSASVWWIFIIFGFGPCEPLIPLLMFPAATSGWAGVALVSLVFGAATILTMTAVTLLAWWGLLRLRLGGAERYAHAMAGGAIALSGLAVMALGL